MAKIISMPYSVRGFATNKFCHRIGKNVWITNDRCDSPDYVKCISCQNYRPKNQTHHAFDRRNSTQYLKNGLR